MNFFGFDCVALGLCIEVYPLSLLCNRRITVSTLPTPAQAQDYERMMAMVTGFWVTQTVRAAALYKLADHLAEGTDTPDAIAQAEEHRP